MLKGTIRATCGLLEKEADYATEKETTKKQKAKRDIFDFFTDVA